MNAIKYLLDTNNVLYMLGGNQTFAEHLHFKNLYASFITEIELLVYKNLSAKEANATKDFLSQFRIINIDEAIKTEAIQLRKQ
jgi:predicted nucleic acid-binding protein